MEETDQQHKPLLLESQKDAVVEHASQEEEADKQHRTFKPMFLDSQEDLFVDAEASMEKSKQCGAPIGKVWFGLIALVLAIAAVIAFCNNGSQPLSDIDLLANVVMPGVDISNLNETTPQYRALEWLAYNDTRGLTINDDAIELLERFSLATFYYSGGRGDSLPKFDNDWLTSSHCDWAGLHLTCDEDGRVTTLDSSNSYFEMHGTLPTEIGNLKRLRHLNVGSRELVGPIPSEIGNLQQLENLYLDQNKLSGPIPSEIGNLQQLKRLFLEHNKLSGPIPSEIGHLQQLIYLGLYQNNFSGLIPSEIGHLQQLQDLVLSHNIGLTGTVPVEVGQLKSIAEASFSNTSLTGGLDDLAFCKNREIYFTFSIRADCGGLNPKITCECCTECCGIDENGRNPCGER